MHRITIAYTWPQTCTQTSALPPLPSTCATYTVQYTYWKYKTLKRYMTKSAVSVLGPSDIHQQPPSQLLILAPDASTENHTDINVSAKYKYLY